MNFTTEAKEEVLRYLGRGEKIAAIKYLCDTFSISLVEAKTLVEAAEAEYLSSIDTRPKTRSTTLDVGLRLKVTELLQQGNKIEAVKEVKTALGINLKDALVMVEEVERVINPNTKPIQARMSGCAGGVLKLMAYVFLFIGLALIAGSGVMYFFQMETIANGETITGKVVEFQRGDEGGVAPIVAYSWNGQEKRYYSNVYSTPPAYQPGEEVSVIINATDPEDVILDTFSERWLVIVILGAIGLFFAGFGSIFLFAGRKV